MIFHRTLSDELNSWRLKPGRKPLLLMGARQTGKTFLLKQFGSKHFRKCLCLNFEEDFQYAEMFAAGLNPKKIIEKISLILNVDVQPENDFIIFDEIQACPPALTSLKYFCEELPQLALAAAGSLLGVMLTPVSFPVGKIDRLTLHPLSFPEFLKGCGAERYAEFLLNYRPGETFLELVHSEIWDLFRKYLFTGGMPEAAREWSDNRENIHTALEAVRRAQLDLLADYRGDIAKHAGASNALHIERILASIPVQQARVVDDSVKRFRLRGVVPGISQYSRLVSAFDWLVKAGLVNRVPVIETAQPPLSAHVKESIFKLYLLDTGLLGALGNIPSRLLLDFETGTYKGYLAENFAAQALCCAGWDRLYGWTSNSSEIEFLCEGESGVMPVEVKSGRVTQAKSLQVFIKKHKPSKAFIFGGTTPRADGCVRRLPLYLAGIYDLEKG